ncbi:hypothetical protein SS1G_02347 [Sclerotinia sclerotiorum 1980 UF-70]|uniref:Uncharacterized protein n=1 Tax=Sclerotinia sclerotiorum (strain ATCC 18683 / 1980 / Ss-1) TaxID=665079 RepID=A7EAL5_SCLS1|nr:hypothetical protein SS1G_02347 [Sclerotinia sclerotiorum 1980 UF-70]EDN99493.1 hypothetical protein SS1G_02347 [Sclerotinia sclerotiorum 1980 UF-70]
MELCRIFFFAVVVSTYGKMTHASSGLTSSISHGASESGVLTPTSVNGSYLYRTSRATSQNLASTTSLVLKNTHSTHNSIQLSSSQIVASVGSHTVKGSFSNGTNTRVPHLNSTYSSTNFTHVQSKPALTNSEDESNTRSVFTHFMVGNVPSWDISAWEADIKLAMEAHIDAFALNVAFGDEGNQNSVANAFSAAELQGFKWFFSFDYAGGISAWPLGTVVDYIRQYSSTSAYFQYLGCFFMPDWSSLGAKAALELGQADGLFSWAAWPYGPFDMDADVDASYLQFLNETGTPLPYMMPVSPWSFKNLPGYDKNWIWRGDDLWFDRWEEVWYIRPDLVEIITWNDFGESHYIGPLHSEAEHKCKYTHSVLVRVRALGGCRRPYFLLGSPC